MNREFIELPTSAENLPTQDIDTENHAMNNPEEFRSRLLNTGQERMDINEQVRTGQMSHEEGQQRLAEITQPNNRLSPDIANHRLDKNKPE